MKKFIGYGVADEKRGITYDYDGNTDDITTIQSWPTKEGAQEVIGEIDYMLKNYKNKFVRKLRRQRKHIKIVKVYISVEKCRGRGRSSQSGAKKK